jgi:hypothetical protein
VDFVETGEDLAMVEVRHHKRIQITKQVKNVFKFMNYYQLMEKYNQDEDNLGLISPLAY